MTVTVGAGRTCVTVTVGAGRTCVTVTVGPGTGTLTVTGGAGLRMCRGLVAPRRVGSVIAISTASPTVAPIVSQAPARRFLSFLRCPLSGRDACGAITR